MAEKKVYKKRGVSTKSTVPKPIIPDIESSHLLQPTTEQDADVELAAAVSAIVSQQQQLPELYHMSNSPMTENTTSSMSEIVKQEVDRSQIVGEIIGSRDHFVIYASKQEPVGGSSGSQSIPSDTSAKDHISSAVDSDNASVLQTSQTADFESPPSSQLESEQLKLLSEQLCSLNAHSGHITTHIHRRQTPLRGRLAAHKRQSLSTPRKCVSILSPACTESLRSPRSTPRKSSFNSKTPVKVKFAFPASPSKSKGSSKKKGSAKKSPALLSPLKFPTPDKKQTKRKLYTDSPDDSHGKGKKKMCRRFSPEFQPVSLHKPSDDNHPLFSDSWTPTLSDILSSVNEAISPVGRKSARMSVLETRHVQQCVDSRDSTANIVGTSSCDSLAIPSFDDHGSVETPGKSSVTASCSRTIDEWEVPKKASLKAKTRTASSPNKLEIAMSDEENFGDDDGDIDVLLDEKSSKINLTATNVRSIIHQLITNEHVQDLVRNTLMEHDGHLGVQLKEAIFEPKMTRSKLKEVIQKGHGTLPTPWILSSPMKCSVKPSFLDMCFPEDDDDDEYRPTLDELEVLDELEPYCSDEESVVSSQASDLESPRPVSSTPRSRSVSSSLVNCESQVDITSPILRSVPMGPPSCLPFRRRQLLMTPQDTSLSDDEQNNIALRTRSKLPLNDTPLDVIESSFIAPDITSDLYDDPSSLICDDDDWRCFLSSLYKHDQDVTDDDEANDPEYNIMDEPDEDDEEEVRNDKATRISKREVSELWQQFLEEFEPDGLELNQTGLTDELNASQNGTTTNPGDVSNTAPGDVIENSEPVLLSMPDIQSQSFNTQLLQLQHLSLDHPLINVVVHDLMMSSSSSLVATTESNDEVDVSSLPVFMSDELVQLRIQINKHVQLLAQTYVLATPSDDLETQSAAVEAKKMLTELKTLASTRDSYLMAPNLDGAIAITERDIEPDDEIRSQRMSIAFNRFVSNKLYQLNGLYYNQMDVILTSPVFMLPEILPQNRFIPYGSYRQTRVMFSTAEDSYEIPQQLLLGIFWEVFDQVSRPSFYEPGCVTISEISMLLAMGLDQFGHLPNKYSFISKFLLPTKTASQLMFRAKNCKNTPRNVANAVKHFYNHKTLPVFRRWTDLEPATDMIAPILRHRSVLPKWVTAYDEVKQYYVKTQSEKSESGKSKGSATERLSIGSASGSTIILVPLIQIGSSVGYVGSGDAKMNLNGAEVDVEPDWMDNVEQKNSDDNAQCSRSCSDVHSVKSEPNSQEYPRSSTEDSVAQQMSSYNQNSLPQSSVSQQDSAYSSQNYQQSTSHNGFYQQVATYDADCYQHNTNNVAYYQPVTCYRAESYPQNTSYAGYYQQVTTYNTKSYAQSNYYQPVSAGFSECIPQTDIPGVIHDSQKLNFENSQEIDGTNCVRNDYGDDQTVGCSKDDGLPSSSSCINIQTACLSKEVLSDSSLSTAVVQTEVLKTVASCSTTQGENQTRCIPDADANSSFHQQLVESPMDTSLHGTMKSVEVPELSEVSNPAMSSNNTAVILTNLKATSSIVVSENQFVLHRQNSNASISVSSPVNASGGPVIVLTASQLRQLGITVSMLPLTTVSTSKISSKAASPVSDSQSVPCSSQDFIETRSSERLAQNMFAQQSFSGSCQDIVEAESSERSVDNVCSTPIYSSSTKNSSKTSSSEGFVSDFQESSVTLSVRESRMDATVVRPVEAAENPPMIDQHDGKTSRTPALPKSHESLFRTPAAIEDKVSPLNTENVTPSLSAIASTESSSSVLTNSVIEKAHSEELNANESGDDTLVETTDIQSSVDSHLANDEKTSLDFVPSYAAPLSKESNCGSVENQPLSCSSYASDVENDDVLVSSDMDLSSVDIAMLNGSLSPESCSNSMDVSIDMSNSDTLMTPKKPDTRLAIQSSHHETASSWLPGLTSTSSISSPLLSHRALSKPLVGSPHRGLSLSKPASVVQEGTTMTESNPALSKMVFVAATAVRSSEPLVINEDGAIAAELSKTPVRSASSVQSPASDLESPLKHCSINFRPILPRETDSPPLSKCVSPLIPKVKQPRRIAVAAQRNSGLVPIAPKGFILVTSQASPTNQKTRARNHRTAESKKPLEKSPNPVPILPKESQSERALEDVEELIGCEDRETLETNDLDGLYVDMPLIQGDAAVGPVSDDDTGVDEVEDDCEDDDLMNQESVSNEAVGSSMSQCNGLVNLEKSKSQLKLSTDLLSPPDMKQREESDERFAQQYLHRVCNKLLADSKADLYIKFIKLLTEFGQESSDPLTATELYKSIRLLLRDYPDLASDFSMFLLPGQAVECNCFMDNFSFTTATAFMSKLRMHVSKFPSRQQRVQKVLKKWSDGRIDDRQLRDSIVPLIRSNPKLLEEFLQFFDDVPPLSQSSLDDFEQVVINDSDDESQSDLFAEYERVDITAKSGKDGFGTGLCPCRCHVVSGQAAGSKPVLKHCHSCALKVIRGRLYLQTTDRILRPATVVNHDTAQLNAVDLPDQQPMLNDNNTSPLFNLSDQQPLLDDNNTSRRINLSDQQSLLDDDSSSRRINLSDQQPMLNDSNTSPLFNLSDQQPLLDDNNTSRRINLSDQQSLLDDNSSSRTIILPDQQPLCDNNNTSVLNEHRTDSRGSGLDVLPDKVSPQSGVVDFDEVSVQQLPEECESSKFASIPRDNSDVTGARCESSCGTAPEKDCSTATTDAACSNEPEIGNPDPVAMTRDDISRRDDSSQRDEISQRSNEDETQHSSFLPWTRDEDRVILEMCKACSPNASTYDTIASSLIGRSAAQIAERFKYLLGFIASLNRRAEQSESESDEDSCSSE